MTAWRIVLLAVGGFLCFLLGFGLAALLAAAKDTGGYNSPPADLRRPEEPTPLPPERVCR